LRDELSFEMNGIWVGRLNSNGSGLNFCDLNFDNLFRDPDVARQLLEKLTQEIKG